MVRYKVQYVGLVKSYNYWVSNAGIHSLTTWYGVIHIRCLLKISTLLSPFPALFVLSVNRVYKSSYIVTRPSPLKRRCLWMTLWCVGTLHMPQPSACHSTPVLTLLWLKLNNNYTTIKTVGKVKNPVGGSSDVVCLIYPPPSLVGITDPLKSCREIPLPLPTSYGPELTAAPSTLPSRISRH